MLQFLFTLSDESNHNKIEHIYNKYHDYMMKYAVSKFKSMGRMNFVYDSEDAVQNAFVKITKYIDNIDFNRGEKDVKNYCFSILNNEICNVLSDSEEILEFDEDFFTQSEHNFVDELIIREKYNEVVKIIESLDERYSSTLHLVFCHEQTPNDIAKTMGISVKTVYTRLARGKQLLLDSLKGAKIDG